ncbi:MAG: pentapeptide repeat-containing protein, partial [Gallionella sp.]|nr:pentapeptide repeat-containing protein [Gallionella sp.]
MRSVTGLALLSLMIACPMSGAATADELQSYTAPAADTSRDGKLTARDVTQQLFKAAPGSRPDLHETNLSLLDLAELDFKHANMAGSDLYGSDLSRAKLTGVSLVGARLDRT